MDVRRHIGHLRMLTAAALVAIGAGIAPASFAASQGDISAARSRIEGFHATLLDVMKHSKTLGIDERFERLEPTIAKTFDLTLMTALSTGLYWRKASPAERQRLVDAFGRMSTATYASRFSGWSGQSFETVSVDPGPRGTLLVHTRINQPEKEAVRLTYVMRPRDKAWRIVDVLVDDGISELAVRRSEYRTALASGGASALIDLLKRKTSTLLAP